MELIKKIGQLRIEPVLKLYRQVAMASSKKRIKCTPLRVSVGSTDTEFTFQDVLF